MTNGKSLDEWNWPYDQDHLPYWFTRPFSDTIKQATLFALEPSNLEEVLAALRISVDDLSRWHGQGWISFDLDINERIEQWHFDELRFVRDVVRSGLTDAQIETLLAKLPRPMNFDPALVAYSFSFGWVQAVPPQEPDVSEFIEEHLGDWIRELAEADPDRLIELRDQLDKVLESIESESREDGSVDPLPEGEQ